MGWFRLFGSFILFTLCIVASETGPSKELHASADDLTDDINRKIPQLEKEIVDESFGGTNSKGSTKWKHHEDLSEDENEPDVYSKKKHSKGFTKRKHHEDSSEDENEPDVNLKKKHPKGPAKRKHHDDSSEDKYEPDVKLKKKLNPTDSNEVGDPDEEDSDEDEYSNEIQPKNIIDDIKHGASAAADAVIGMKDQAMTYIRDKTSSVEDFLGMDINAFYQKFINAVKESKTKQWVKSIDKKFNISKITHEIKKAKITDATCMGCKVLVTLAQSLFTMGKSDETVAAVATNICRLLGSYFEAKDPSVCKGMIDSMGIDAIYAMRHADMSPSQICQQFFGEECEAGYHEKHTWGLSLPKKTKQARKISRKSPEKNARILKVLQITDIHYDKFYQPGSESDCDMPACCRGSVGYPAKSLLTAAGKWGDYRKCDSPSRLIENAFEHISKTHKDLDYILWTGDVPGHDIWNQSREANIEKFKFVTELLGKYFGDVLVLPTVGNHESFPIDSFIPPSLKPGRDMEYLYEELATEWSRWLPDDKLKTVRDGGYYSYNVTENLRVISVNGNYCGRNNFLLMINSTDPYGQLDWLINELQTAENNGEKVHIINHVPPGGPDCMKAWSHTYYNIINRFENIIKGQFYGHTHFDEFEVFYDTTNFERAVGVAYIAPSITPWKDCNPAYRIYHVDETTGSILDFEVWKLNLDEANKNDDPQWVKAYEAKSEYDMKSLEPEDWDDLVQRMSKNRTLFDIYYRNVFRDTPTMPPCDKNCRFDYICNTRVARSQDKKFLCGSLQVN